jgi:hypothetical protein
VEFSKVPGITHYCTGDGLSVKSIPGKNGIDDGYTGAIRVPWYLFNFTAKTYTEPFGTVTPNEIERGTVTIAGEERAILNVKLNSLATIIEIKLAGLQDG